ncbi:hypothetical protein ACMBCM_10025 [Spiroplasma sp. K1]
MKNTQNTHSLSLLVKYIFSLNYLFAKNNNNNNNNNPWNNLVLVKKFSYSSFYLNNLIHII